MVTAPKSIWSGGEGRRPLRLADGATIVVIGGGPAGAFFAIHCLRKARAMALRLHLIILERHKEYLVPNDHACPRRGCNYCAGGISPRLNDVLRELGIALPVEIIKNEVQSITLQSFWKNIEFMVPPGRQMRAVYRGSLPAHRKRGFQNLDAFLLEQAIREGGILQEGEATLIDYSAAGKPTVTYERSHEKHCLEADFVVLAGGVNPVPGQPFESQRLMRKVMALLPGYLPPKLRQALIFELELDPEHALELEREIFFVEYGSKSLPLDMCSLIPKGRFVTVVLMGPAIDHLTDHALVPGVIHEFLQLPHIKKILPRRVKLENTCACHPNMVVGIAKNPFANGIAMVGDLATARLYKDGILSACETAAALADTLLTLGIDAESLRRGYWPAVKRIGGDNRYGRWVFLLHNIIFRSPVLSRILYQAIISERKEQFKERRRLESILWKIASGDDSYRNILLAMMHPSTAWTILTKGVIVTFRNYLTEQVFGLHWRGFGRFTTGVAIERLESKRREYLELMESHHMERPRRLEFERMYSIRIRAPRGTIAREIGEFGERDRKYFTPRLVRVSRTRGVPNQPGCVIQYQVITRGLNFSLILEQTIDQRYYLYRVIDGFARNGALIFEIEEGGKRTCLLSIYVAFDFYRGAAPFTKPLWWALKRAFPAFMHDVIWNHSLCQLKDNAEERAD